MLTRQNSGVRVEDSVAQYAGRTHRSLSQRERVSGRNNNTAKNAKKRRVALADSAGSHVKRHQIDEDDQSC